MFMRTYLIKGTKPRFLALWKQQIRCFMMQFDARKKRLFAQTICSFDNIRENEVTTSGETLEMVSAALQKTFVYQKAANKFKALRYVPQLFKN